MEWWRDRCNHTDSRVSERVLNVGVSPTGFPSEPASRVDAYPSGMTSPLTEYQKTAVRFALHHSYCGLFLDMGLGKTLTSIAVMDLCRRRGEGLKWLVVVPAQLIRQRTWERELDKWAAYHQLSCQSLGVPVRQRLAACRQTGLPDVTLVSAACLPWLDAHVAVWPWTGLIVDELSAYRNPRSQRFRILKRRRHGMRRIIGLTGTPVPKSLENLWAEIHVIDGGQALGASITRYRSEWFHPGARNWRTGVVYSWEPNPGAFDEIMTAIQPFCLSMSRRDFRPDIPDPIVDVRPVGMPAGTRSVYDRLLSDLTVDLQPGEITAGNAGVLTNRLSQLTAGFLYPNRENLQPSIPLAAGGPNRVDGRAGQHPGSGDEIIRLTITGYDPRILNHDDPDAGMVMVDAQLGDGRIIRLSSDSYLPLVRGGALTIHPTPSIWEQNSRDLDTMKLDELTGIGEASIHRHQTYPQSCCSVPLKIINY